MSATVAGPLTMPPAHTLGEHVRRTVLLALPVAISRWGVLIMVTIAHAMTGHASTTQQAYFDVGFFPQMVMLVVGMGLMMGVTVLSAQANGGGHAERCGRIWQVGLIAAVVLSMLFVCVMWWGEALLRLLGQSADIAAGGGAVLWTFAAGVPAILMFVATSAFLESIGRVWPGTAVSLTANIVNGGLCWVLVFGHLGSPAMGAIGAALAITATRWFMLACLLVYTLGMKDGAHYGVRAPLAGSYQTLVKLLRVGAPLALAQVLESTAFAWTTNMAGWLGSASLAAFYSALNLNANVFMVGLGIATATSVRVANAVGRRDQTGVRLAGWTGAGLGVVVTALIGVAIALWRQPIAFFYSHDPAVQEITVDALAIVAWLSVVDTVQSVLAGATRGVADVIVPTVTQGIAFWGIAVPLAYHLGYAGGYGVNGLFWGLGISLIAASLFLALRFQALTRRVIRPV